MKQNRREFQLASGRPIMINRESVQEFSPDGEGTFVVTKWGGKYRLVISYPDFKKWAQAQEVR